MSRYDDYEDLDEYETEGEEYSDEGDEEREQEPVRKPTRDELEYLELRKKLKERVRKKLKKESGMSLANGRDKKHNLPHDNYGSFFGPSQPVIAQRVLQESKSLLENPHLAARVSKSNNGSSKTVTSAPSGSRPHANNDHHRPQKVPEVIAEKSKAEILKDTRDYSFLLSDDQDVPTQTKAPPPRNMSVSRTEASRSSHVQHKSKNPVSSSSSRKYDNGHDERRSAPKSNQSGGAHRPASSNKPNSTSADPRRQSTQNGSGPGRPLQTSSRPSAGSSRPPVTSSRPPVTSSRPPVTSSRPPVTSSRPTSQNSRPTAQTSRPAAETSRPAAQTSRAAIQNSRPTSQNSRPASQNSRPTAQNSRPLPKGQLSTKPMEQRANVAVQRNSSVAPLRKQLPPNSQASSSKRPLDHRRGYQESDRGKIMLKQQAPTSRPQMKQPAASNQTRAPLQVNRPKKRPPRSYDDEDEEDPQHISNLIQGLFRYNRSGYQDDDDISDMEAGFDDIMMEEKRSARIARREDEEELKKIEEEERRERMRKEAKKRKLK